MLTVHRTRQTPHDSGVAVIVDLPHAADLPARPHLCSLTTADTHEQITGVLGMSMHFDTDPARGDYDLWVVAEQLVDEHDQPLPIGDPLRPDFHSEYFRGSVRTALFRYRVAGFTTGPAMDRSSTWHRAVADHHDRAAATGPRLTEYEVTFTNHMTGRVQARHFEYADGFVAFYDAECRRTDAYRIGEVRGVRSVSGVRPLVVDETQLAVLRSAVLWDEQRIADSGTDDAGDYRTMLRDVLTGVLGMIPDELPDRDGRAVSGVNACCEQPDERQTDSPAS